MLAQQSEINQWNFLRSVVQGLLELALNLGVSLLGFFPEIVGHLWVCDGDVVVYTTLS
jgi:hypothetical protein